MPNQHYSFYPDKGYARELILPWKLFTFGVAMTLLLYGAVNFHISDWDVGVTLLMGALTYLMAPWAAGIISASIRYRPRFWYLHLFAALFSALFVVDWAYMGYHTLVGNQTLREANFYASMPIYLMAGFFWLYRGSLRELVEGIRMVLKNK